MRGIPNIHGLKYSDLKARYACVFCLSKMTMFWVKRSATT